MILLPPRSSLFPYTTLFRSNSGWDTKSNLDFLTDVLDRFNSAGIRTSVFVAADPEMVEYAAKAGTDRVELYTEPYASKFAENPEAAVAPFIEAAKKRSEEHTSELQSRQYLVCRL